MNPELDYVTIIKLTTGEELVGLLSGHDEDTIRLDHPFIIRYDEELGSVQLLPFCLWSEDVTFTFNNNFIIYVVSCSERIAIKYLDFIEDLHQKEQVKNTTELENQLDKLEAFIKGEEYVEETYPAPSLVIEGNDTKH